MPSNLINPIPTGPFPSTGKKGPTGPKGTSGKPGSNSRFNFYSDLRRMKTDDKWYERMYNSIVESEYREFDVNGVEFKVHSRDSYITNIMYEMDRETVCFVNQDTDGLVEFYIKLPQRMLPEHTLINYREAINTLAGNLYGSGKLGRHLRIALVPDPENKYDFYVQQDRRPDILIDQSKWYRFTHLEKP